MNPHMQETYENIIDYTIRMNYGDEQAEQALDLWREKYRDSPSFSLRAFASDFAKLFLSGRSGGVYQLLLEQYMTEKNGNGPSKEGAKERNSEKKGLLAGMMSGGGSTSRSSQNVVTQADTNPNTETPGQRACNSVLFHLLEALMRGICNRGGANLNAKEVEAWLLDASRAAGVSPQKILAWQRYNSSGQQLDFTLLMTQKQAQTLLQSMYNKTCDELGPVLTDRLIGSAIQIAENTREAMEFSPRNLL